MIKKKKKNLFIPIEKILIMAPPVIIYSSLTTAQNKSPPYRFINIVFGLEILGEMENIGRKTEWKLSFPLFGNERKIGGGENLGENFLPRPTKFFLPNWEEKQWGKTALRQFYLNALPFFCFFQSDWTFFFHFTWPEHSSFPFFFFSRDLNFFFFQRDTSVLVQPERFFFFSTWLNLIFTL